MPIKELDPIFNECAAAVRDETARKIARYIAGRYGDDHPMAGCLNRGKSDEDRTAFATALLHTIDTTLSIATQFLEEKIGAKELAIAIKNCNPAYEIDGTDMLRAWFDDAIDRYRQVTPAGLIELVKQVAAEKKKRQCKDPST